MASSCMNAPRIMVFRPTMEDMKDFSGYISHMESKGAHLAGVAKVIPPKEFVPRQRYDDIDMVIPAPIQQEVMGHQGLYTQYNIQKKAMTVEEYRKLANSTKFCTPPHFDYEDLERKYWKNITYNSPIYGADISGSIYEKGWKIWNINRLNTILDLIEEEEGVKIEGVNTAYLYFGMWKTTFAWHTEDMDLYSINYIHYGAPKTWYAIPTEHARRLERLAAGFFPGSFADCSNFLRHKMTVIAPYILKKYSIPYDKITQEVGEFMITFPYGYHSGFNHGYNIAESTNFASLRWINFGKRASSCTCSKDSVKIGMNPFVRVFQPDRYEAWMDGRDVIYLPEVDGPNPPTVSHRVSVRNSPEKASKGKEVKVHRRHPVHKKGVNVEPKVKKEVKVKTVKEDPDNVRSKKKKEKKKEEEEEDKSALSKEEKKLRKKLKKEKKRRHSKDKHQETSLEKIRKIGSKSPVIKVKHVCDLAQLAEAAERVAASSGLDIPSGSKIGSMIIKVELSASGDSASVHRTEMAVSSNSQMNIGSKFTNGQSEGEHTYSSSSATSRRKKSKPRIRNVSCNNLNSSSCSSTEDSIVKTEDTSTEESIVKTKDTLTEYSIVKTENTLTEDSIVKTENTSTEDSIVKSEDMTMDYGITVKQEPLEEASSQELQKITQRGSSLIPTRTNSDGTLVSHTHSKACTSKEWSSKMKNWVRSMNGLWIIQPAQFAIEQIHNLSMADQKPGCCVCMIFFNEKADNFDWGDDDTAFSSSVSQVAGTSQDQRLRVLCPEMCFACSIENPTPELVNSYVGSDGRSPILNCVSCKIAVHASCFGEDPATASDEWTCNRCTEEDWQAVCCLCNLRGGALKPTTTGHWAHIVCAMAVGEVSFQDVKMRSPINVTNITNARLKLKCYYCRSFIKCSPKYASCIQCSVGKCALSFHVTCAKAAGVMMEPSDWPYPVYATCCKHPFANKDIVRRGSLQSVSAGERIIAKHKNSRFYEAEVIGERQQMFCHVNFYDNSFSENLFPEDIKSHNISRDGPPNAGNRVKVRWTDGILYDGAYVKDSLIKIYDVEFEDGSIVTVKREDIYTNGEDIPKKVRTKLSVASDMRHHDFYGNKVIGEKHRHVSSRYATPSAENTDQSDSSSSEAKD